MAAWGRLGENCQQYLSKGRKVAAVGPVSVSTYQANDGTTRASMEVYAEDVEFLSSTGAGAPPTNNAEPAPEQTGGFTAVETEGELPF